MTPHRAARFRARYGPWAVVTGASSGIGREIALQLGEAGLKLALVARRESELQRLADTLRSRHDAETVVIAADLGRPQGVEAVALRTRDLDVGLLVAAAGFGTSGPFAAADAERELAMLELNCRTPLLQSLDFGRRFVARGRGGIVLLGSIVALQGTPNAAHYAATKAYVHTLGEALHLELGAAGVDVLVSAPGPTRSGFATRAGMTMGAALEPDAVARATLAALGRRAVTLPGGLSRLLGGSLGLLPRGVRSRLMGRIMAGMADPGGRSPTSGGDPAAG